MLLSGFYEKDIPVLKGAIEANGMKIAEIKTEGEQKWAALKCIPK